MRHGSTEHNEQIRRAHTATKINVQTSVGRQPSQFDETFAKQMNAAIAHKHELQRKTAEALAELVRSKQKLEEASRFFNLPSAAADYRHGCNLANWTLDEAVALSLGKHPRKVNWNTVSPYVQISPFAKEYE